jgi:hypothetical protein
VQYQSEGEAGAGLGGKFVMSYMRGEYYIWMGGTEEDSYISLPTEMPSKVFDELVAMRWAELNAEEKADAGKRAVEKYAGNVGCEALCKLLGVPGFQERLEVMLKSKKEKNDEAKSSD